MRPVRRPVGVVILAAGKGTRMRSRLPKVAHQIAGRAMLEHVLRAASAALTSTESPSADAEGDSTGGQTAYTIVVGHEREQVREAIHFTPPTGEPQWILQEPQLGTGDAVRAARETLTSLPTPPATVLVLYGDTPLVRAETLRALLAEHERANAILTFLTGIADRPTDYGHVIRDEQRRIAGIVEARHATPEQLALSEVNSGIYCFQANWLWSRLDRLEPHENGEYYLTDLIAVAVREGAPLATVSGSIEETGGVNDRVQLAEAARVLRERILLNLMLSGVTIEDPATTYIDAGARVGQDTIIRPGTTLSGATVIGERCVIGPQSVIRDSQIGDDCLALASWVEEAVMEPGSRVGPMSHLRPGARLTSGANVGNFAEIKNATLGADVQMHHFSYVGDASIGARTNVAAGVITSNFSADGKKYRTEVGEDVFLGSDSQLVAPISIGDYAMIGGGSVVRRDVPPGGVAVGIPARVIKHRRKPDAETQDAGTPDAHETAAQDTIEGMNATDRTAMDRTRE
ncbi:MAG TPA: bifunctional UDP-N-acetylglucosamine diphosphorylase/glucosamine-1-phosphate N-acetyltransferase GlmU [Ktedonobacterales bacterium]|jgi:bifunctional UDP-N-acetylglucosamine pyrophosphorylase/glucosamine-1-phosphate N-acetyltransferase